MVDLAQDRLLPSLRSIAAQRQEDLLNESPLGHGYRFVRTSNFCEPQFEGMWVDIAWHQKMTTLIKAGT